MSKTELASQMLIDAFQEASSRGEDIQRTILWWAVLTTYKDIPITSETITEFFKNLESFYRAGMKYGEFEKKKYAELIAMFNDGKSLSEARNAVHSWIEELGQSAEIGSYLEYGKELFTELMEQSLEDIGFID